MTKSMTEAPTPPATRNGRTSNGWPPLSLSSPATQPAATLPAAKRGHVERAAERSEAALIN
jgi:hypothetical protein